MRNPVRYNKNNPPTPSIDISDFEKSTNEYLKNVRENKKPKGTSFGDFIATKGLPIYRGENTGYYDSKYDEGLNWDAQIDDEDIQGSLNEYRAQKQPIINKVAAGLGRVGVKVASETAKLPGFIGGAVAAPFVEDGKGIETAVNNEWIKTINNWNKEVNDEYLPVYVKKAVSEGNLWDNVSSIDFWATEGADGIGFIAAMMVPGAIFKGLGLGSKAMGLTTKGLALANTNSKLAGAVRTVESLGLSANKFDIVGTAMANTYVEAAAESGGAMQAMDDKKDDIVMGYMEQNPNLTPEQAEEQFNTQKARLGRDLFVSNVGILAIPNMIQSKMIWGKAAGKLIAKETPSLLGKVGNRLGNIAGATASEGFLEEAGQSTVEKMFNQKAERGQLKEGYTGLDDYNIGELGDAYLDTVSSTEGQKAMFLGAFLGGGMSAYHGAKSDISNRKQTNSILELTEKSVNHFNNITEKDTYQRDNNGEIVYNLNNEPQQDPVKVMEVVKSLNLTETKSKEFEQAVAEGNVDVVEKLKEEAVNQLILPYARTGEMGIQALEQYLKETSKSESVAGNNVNNKSESFIKNIVERATFMQKKFDTYQDFSRTLVNLQNKNAKPNDYESFYNNLADTYVTKEGERFESKKKLQSLNKQKSELLNELDDSTTTLEPNTNFLEGTTEELYKNKRSDVDPRIKLLNDKIFLEEDNIKTIDSQINEDLWDSKKVNEAFDIYVNNNNIVRDVAEKDKHDELIDGITNSNEEAELDKILKDNKEWFDTRSNTSGPIVKNQLEKRRQEIVARKKAEDIAKKKEREAEIVVNNESPTGEHPDVVTNTPTPVLEEGIESTQSNDSVEVDSEGFTVQTEIKDTESPISKDPNQGAAILIPLESFKEYQEQPRDKRNDKVSFSQGDGMKPINQKALDVLKDTSKLDVDKLITISEKLRNVYTNLKPNFELTKNELESDEHLLLTALPLKVTLLNGTETGFSFMDDLTSNSPEHVRIATLETLPLRTGIIQSIIENNGSFEGIEGKVEKQFPGLLDVDDFQNNISNLQMFKGKSEQEIAEYIRDNTGYVDFKGNFKSTKTGAIDDKLGSPQFVKGNPQNHKGEVFLKILNNAGLPFYLKLNNSQISESKSDSLISLITLKFSLNADDLLIRNLKKFLSENNPELLHSLMLNLGDELKFLEDNEDESINKTINKLISLLIHNGNTTLQTAFGIYFKNETLVGKDVYSGDTQIQLGSLFSKFYDGALTGKTFTKEQFLELSSQPEFRDALNKFFRYKRHNVLFNMSKGIRFSNLNYIKYLTSGDNPILTTNANTTQTFKGYSNIYINQSVTNKVKKVVSEVQEELPSNESQADEIMRLLGPQPTVQETTKMEEVIKVDSVDDVIKFLDDLRDNNDEAYFDLIEKKGLMENMMDEDFHQQIAKLGKIDLKKDC